MAITAARDVRFQSASQRSPTNALNAVEAGAADGKVLTSYPSLKTDIINAGGTWVDEEVKVDGNLITSRTPQDLDAFGQAIIDMLAG